MVGPVTIPKWVLVGMTCIRVVDYVTALSLPKCEEENRCIA